ncbi:hypothetical protein [Ktedonobacter racemifer]|uniref:Uncharacterized protein n=1 Tax=Ktedonobacter racemifer DSM 44963 TaxID=485913 RepID=D6U642_KTERA|nr:hypothetical protein [Ktedonobacter racemifer]EFH80453.1 hypothetical protein Krac_1055 [Ktedonobacter racemifer DSM 44963]
MAPRRGSRQQQPAAGQVYSTVYYTPPAGQLGITTYKTLDEMSERLTTINTEIIQLDASRNLER